MIPPFAQLARANNPGAMTLDGTNTWLLAHDGDSYVVVDPGPLMHEERIMQLANGRISAILLTHRHGDHSACAAALAARSQALVFAADPQFASSDHTVLRDGAHLSFGELSIEVIACPGHTSDSVAFLASSGTETALLTGDTILGEGSSIITHPDGDVGAYLDSLDRLESVATAAAGAVPILPGHGSAHDEALPLIRRYRAHRLERLAQIRAAIAEGAVDAESIVDRVYKDVSETLRPAALMAVEAQLAYLNGRA